MIYGIQILLVKDLPTRLINVKYIMCYVIDAYNIKLNV